MKFFESKIVTLEGLHLDLPLHQLQRRLQPQLRNQCCRDLSVGVVLLAPLVFKKKVPQKSKNGAV